MHAQHETLAERPRHADEALARRLLLLGDGEAHDPAVVDCAFDDVGLAGATGTAAAAMRQVDALRQGGIEDVALSAGKFRPVIGDRDDAALRRRRHTETHAGAAARTRTRTALLS